MKFGLIIIATLATMFYACTKSNETGDASTPPATPNIDDSLQIGLIASYPFNGTANDESGNNYNGIVKDAILTTDRFGNQAKAYSFNDSIIVLSGGTSQIANLGLTACTLRDRFTENAH